MHVDDHAAVRAMQPLRTDSLAVGLKVRREAVAGLWGDTDDGGGRCVLSRSPAGGLVKHMACWRVVGGRVPCWLMVAEMSDNSSAESGVNLLGKHSEDQSDASWDIEKSNQSLEVNFSYHIRLPLLSARVLIRCLHLNIFGETAKEKKI